MIKLCRYRRPSFIVALFLLPLALIVISCAVGEEDEIRALKDIPGGFEGPHVQDIGPHSARIVFRTNTPVVCNVAYGTDGDYGRLSLMAMTGPLTDHDVQLLGLEPTTTYHFRVTVTDSASNVYQSDDLTFITSEGGGGTKPSGRNVATLSEGANIVGVSSNWGGGDLDSTFGGNKAIDGLLGTEWSSNGDGDAAWIEIELERRYEINAIGFWTRTMGNTGQIFSFNMITDEGQRIGPFDLLDASTIYYFEVQTHAKRLRFEAATSSGGNTGVVEIEVYTSQGS